MSYITESRRLKRNAFLGTDSPITESAAQKGLVKNNDVD